MRTLRLGMISDLLRPKTVALLSLAAAAVVIALAYRSLGDTSDGCIRCHSDKTKMERLKAPWAYVTQETVRKESGHTTILCRDCHLGDGKSDDLNKAHRGMLKMLVVSENATVLARREGYPYGLGKTGEDKLSEFLPKMKSKGGWVPFPVKTILWHDRNPVTFDFDQDIVSKTCGKAGCHPEELKQFSSSHMGENYRQRTMTTWLKPYGPHNCGPSFADRPASGKAGGKGFNYSNTKGIAGEMDVPFSAEQARDKQKFCNACHAGCLDCHYTPLLPDPSKKTPGGIHTFRKVPTAESCSGFGRGNGICHPGAMHSRRGETYIGGDYSVPRGMEPDTHYKKGIACVACHVTGEGGMGHIVRSPSCVECHKEVEEAMSRDAHKNMDCATCHISELRGYQITEWGPGLVAGKKNPFNKYSLYYGVQTPPILIKDQKGRWMPVKIWPHSLANVKQDVRASNAIQFRWPDGETRDAYFVLGTFNIKEGDKAVSKPDNKHLLWLEIEQAAHPYGPARSCSSCHNGPLQTAVSKWQFVDDQGAAEPFTGEYRIVADEKGIRIEDLRATSPIKVLPGYKLTDFADWLFLKDKWKIPGDFSIKTDNKKYSAYYAVAGALREKIRALDLRSASFDKPTMRRYRELRAFAVHFPEEGLKRLNGEFPK